jgi:serpin B
MHQGVAVDGADPFGGDLFGLLAADGGNLVFSPASIAIALRMALCGARGETAAEIAAALHLSGPDRDGSGLRRLSEELAGLPGDGVTFRAPNTMWVQAGLPLLPEFTTALRGNAAVSVRDADFIRAAEPARQEINELIAKQTEDKITNLLAPGVLDRLTRLVLVNAIYLKAAWRYPFAEAATGDEPFYPAPAGAPVRVPMMHLRQELPYLHGDGFQAVVLPYASRTLAMVIVLPDGGLAALPSGLAGLAAELGGLPRQAKRHQVTLALPRFRQEGEFDLKPTLGQLGIRQAFGRDGDFTGITTVEPLHISAVRHKAYIDVNELGTEAAAATAVAVAALAMRAPAPAVTMTVDHPFVFAITDTASGLVLFLGQVTDPWP